LADKKDADALSAKLDQLARAPKALEQHNRDVANKVQLVAKAGDSSVENSVRSDIEAALSDAAAADNTSKEAFIAAIQPEVATRQAEMRTVVVAAGDTLSIIAQRAYGDTQQFRRIFDANPRVLTSPNHIYPGQVLRIPAI
jgi:nucleoid-associated protein YgaU